MLTEYVISMLLGLPTLLLSILSQVELWQRKEYRWDRMRSYLAGPDGARYLRSWLVAGALFTDAGWLAYMRHHELAAAYIGMAALLSFAIYHGQRIRQMGIRRPVPTFKVISIVVCVIITVVIEARFTFSATEQIALQVATAILLLPLTTAGVIALINMLTHFRKRQIILQATALRRQMKDITVIGITGSYGKTSTKYFLQQLLPDVVATPEHVNSEIGVALDVLRRGQQTGTYIVEMGAYRRGEIAMLARMTRPNIGVITAIGNQHVDLFGSRENILKAKWELIQGLDRDGVAVLNADDPLLIEKAKDYTGKIIWYGDEDEVQASQIKIHPRNITCTLRIGPAKQSVKIPLASRGLFNSVLAAVAAAHAIGVKSANIFQRVQTLTAYPRTMEICTGKNGATIIDDSYSANEIGVLNAIEHLNLFPQTDKRIIMVPLIELGKDGTAVHERIGKALAASGAKVFVYGAAYQKELGQRVYSDSSKLAAAGNNLNETSVILLEGRIPEIVRQGVL